MRKVDVKLDLDVGLDISKFPPFSVQSAFDVPVFSPKSKFDKRFFSPITFGDIRSLRSKSTKVFKNKNCFAPIAVFGFDNKILCEIPCGFCDSCLAVKKMISSKKRFKKNDKKTN